MATLSTVAVDFIANTAKYTQGLQSMSKGTKAWSAGIKKDTQGATDAFDGASKSLDRFAKQIISVAVIQKIGAAFVNAAKSASQLVDEAEKVGATAGEFAVLEMAAQKNGVSIDAIKTSYKELQKSINEALNGTEATAQAILDLGLSYTELSKKDPTDRFYAIVDALNDVKDANKRAELGTLLLGKAYTEVSPLIKKGSGGIQAAGIGALTTGQLGDIDKITKAFEEVGRVLDLQIKKALVEIAPLLISIAKLTTTLLENFKSIAIVTALAFSPAIIAKFGSQLISLGSAITNVLLVRKELEAFDAVLGGVGMKQLIPTKFIESINKFVPSIIGAGVAVKNFAAGLTQYVVLPLAALAGSFTIASYGVEYFAQKFGASSFAASLRENRTVLADWAIELTRVFGFKFAGKTSTEVLADELEYASKKLTEAKDRAKVAADIKINDQNLVNFRNTLESIAKLPLVERYNKLIELQAKFNNVLDPKRQEELNKALAGMNQELLNLKQSTIENIDVGAKRYRQQSEIDLLVRAGIMTESDAYAAKIKLARDEAAQYDEIIKLKQEALNITNNSMIVDKEKESRLKSLGQSYVDLIDPISAVEREIKKVNALQYVKSISDEQRIALENYYKLQLKSTQVGLTGNDRLAAEQKYLETLQQINQYLPAQSQQIDIITMRTMALKNAEIQRFTETVPYFREIAGFGQNFADGLASAIVEGKNFGDALKNVFQDILKQISVLILRTMILQGIMAAIGFISPTSGAAAAFGKMAGLTPRANGGPVNAGDGYRVGERGPETFVPSSNGYIIPNDMAPSETVIVNQTINVQTGVAQTVRAEMSSLLPRFKQEAMAGVLDAKQRGGSYSRAFA